MTNPPTPQSPEEHDAEVITKIRAEVRKKVEGVQGSNLHVSWSEIQDIVVDALSSTRAHERSRWEGELREIIEKRICTVGDSETVDGAIKTLEKECISTDFNPNFVRAYGEALGLKELLQSLTPKP